MAADDSDSVTTDDSDMVAAEDPEASEEPVVDSDSDEPEVSVPGVTVVRHVDSRVVTTQVVESQLVIVKVEVEVVTTALSGLELETDPEDSEADDKTVPEEEEVEEADVIDSDSDSDMVASVPEVVSDPVSSAEDCFSVDSGDETEP